MSVSRPADDDGPDATSVPGVSVAAETTGNVRPTPPSPARAAQRSVEADADIEGPANNSKMDKIAHDSAISLVPAQELIPIPVSVYHICIAFFSYWKQPSTTLMAEEEEVVEAHPPVGDIRVFGWVFTALSKRPFLLNRNAATFEPQTRTCASPCTIKEEAAATAVKRTGCVFNPDAATTKTVPTTSRRRERRVISYPHTYDDDAAYNMAFPALK